MNQILVATIIAVSIIGAGAYAASQVSEVSTASSMSSDIDIEKKSENMNVFFNGSINIINTGKDQSEIAMFRFYDSSGIKVHQVMIPDGTGRTFGADPQVSNSLLTSDDAPLPRHTTQSFSLADLGIVSLVDLGIVSLEDITGELVTKRGRTFPISFDERTNQNGDGTGDGIIEAVEKFLKKLKTNQNGDGTGADTSAGTIEAVEEFLDEWTNQNGVGTGAGTIEAIEEFLEELKTNQNGDGTGAGTGAGTIEAIEEFLEKLKTNQNGDGKTLTDGLGVYLAIQNINTNGKVYFGSGDNPGSQTDIRPYVNVGNNNDWATVTPNVYKIFPNLEFAKEYEYNGGDLIDMTPYTRNELWYDDSEIMSGSHIISQNPDDGITISGTGIIVVKLYPYRDDMLIRGTLNNADIKIVTSPHDLTRISMSENKYVLYENTSPGLGSCGIPDRIVSCFDITVASDSDLSSTLKYDVSYLVAISCTDKNRPVCWTSERRFARGGLGTVISSSSTTDGISVTSLSSLYTGGAGSPESFLNNANMIHKLVSPAPWNEQYSFDNSFEEYIELPDNSYIVANLNDGTVEIKGEHFNPDYDAFFEVDHLPPHIAYDITKNGITGVIGKTNHEGKIFLSRDDVDFGISTSPGGDLKIYPDSVSYSGYLGSALIDMYNKKSIPFNIGNDLVYIPQAFVRLVFPFAAEVKNVSVDDTELNYLNKNYTKNEALMIPVIPGGEIIYATVNGKDVEVLMRYVSAPTQMKQVPQKSSTSSDYAINGVAFATSNISTSTFLTATHDGMMGVNFDLKVGGSADYTTGFTYGEGSGRYETCGVFRDRAGYGHTTCIYHHVDYRLNSITNIASLLSTHEEELVQSLNNGQASKLTVEVDIFRNMEYVETISIYESNSAQASISTTQSKTYTGENSQVHITYPPTSFSDNIAIPVTAGDMMEFVVRVNLSASGIPTQSDIPIPSVFIKPAERHGQEHIITSSGLLTPIDSNESYSSYVKVTTQFGGGVITVGMF